MISVENLTVEFSARPLFAGVSFVIGDRDRIALTGKNGAGKSTLMKIIAGQQQPTSGVVATGKDTRVGYLPQVMELQSGRTVIEETLTAFDDIRTLQADIQRMGAEMASRTDYESEAYMELCERYAHAEERFRMMGGTNFHAEAERTLTGLGFDRAELNRPTSELSGGWRMRIELAKLLLQAPDVLLLDEPTNHLDIESIQWLEQYLAQRAAAVVLVSHDRAFINNVTTRTLEITCGRIWDYKVRYDEYVRLRAERREQQLRAYENQQKEIQDLKDFIERFRYKPTKAVQVQERIKQLARIVPIEVDEVDNSALHLKFPPCQRSGDFPLIVEDLSKSYSRPTTSGPTPLPLPQREGSSHHLTAEEGVDPSQVSTPLSFRRGAGGEASPLPLREGQGGGSAGGEASPYVLRHVNLTIRRGEKVAFVGRNGEGKSTLVKCILGEIPFEGSLKVGHNAQIGYFAQNQAQLLDPELTVFDTIDRVARGDIRTRIRDILGAFMFGGEASDKKVKVLSGGERSRLAMIRLLLEPVNFLILDEPTNHLDMRSKDVLKEAIAAFDGTVIVVSHDREFLDGLVEKVYAFGGGKVREHIGGIYEWINRPTPLPLPQREGSGHPSRQAKGVEPSKVSTPLPLREGQGGGSAPSKVSTPLPLRERQGGGSAPSKVSTPLPQGGGREGASAWAEQKAAARQRKKLERAVADAEAEMSEIESAIAILESQLATPEGASDVSLYEKYSRMKARLADAEAAWLEASEALEQTT